MSLLLAGWCDCALCNAHKMLGRFAGAGSSLPRWSPFLRRGAFKGIYQRFVEFPDNIADYYKHKVEQLKQMGVRPDR